MPSVLSYLALEQSGYTPELMVAIAEVWELPDQAREAAESLKNPVVPVTMLLEEMPRAESALTLLSTLGVAGESFNNSFDGATLKSPEVLSHILNSAAGMTAVTEDSIAAVRAAAEELLTAITDDPTLDTNLRKVLYEHASAIIWAVDQFKILGAEGIVREYDRLTGHFANNPATRIAVANHSALKQAVVKLGSALLIVSGLLANVVAIEGEVRTVFGIEAPIVNSPAPSQAVDPPAAR